MDFDWNDAMQATIGLGVAGNFAGHLEQAGEASDFKSLEIADASAPKGIFPFYVPGVREHFLGRMPVSSTTMTLGSADEKHQPEPEVALLCDLEYASGRVAAVHPRYAMAHNDCSIRRPGARKISEKKNWGACTKGTARLGIEIDHFASGGVLDRYRLASFLVRDNTAHDYGVDSPVTGYSYYGERLLAWVVDKLATQRDEGPLEDLPQWIERAGHPTRALISIGATRYTEYGETTFLEPGDTAVVALYDSEQYDADAIRRIASGKDLGDGPGLSLLRQTAA